MSVSTRRAIRTAIQVVFGVLAGAAVLLPLAGASLHIAALTAAGATVVTISAGASKAWNALYAAGRIPGYLQDANDSQAVTDAVDAALGVDSHDH